MLNQFIQIIKITKGSLYNLQLEKSTINIERKNNNNIIKSSLKTKGKLNFEQIKKILYFSNFNFVDVKEKILPLFEEAAFWGIRAAEYCLNVLGVDFQTSLSGLVGRDI